MDKSPARTVFIAGGGPAGSSLAIRLARDGHIVTLAERSVFPRHKLCGEFISPECLPLLDELSVLQNIELLAPPEVSETRFYAGNGTFASIASKWFTGERAAIALSRAALDETLLRAASASGVHVVENERVCSVSMNAGVIEAVNCRTDRGISTAYTADLFIDATGHARALTAAVERSAPGKQRSEKRRAKFVGIKVHLRGAEPEHGVCEIYFFKGGYGGIVEIENGAANLCCLVRAETARHLIGNTNQLLDEIGKRNSRAADVLRNAVPLFKPITVSVPRFGESRSGHLPDGLFSVGDAAGFIDPFTGSGILLALESSKLLADIIAEHGDNAAAAAVEYSRIRRRMFRRRFRTASILRMGALMPAVAGMIIRLTRHSEAMTAGLAILTRNASATDKKVGTDRQ